jgi:hypothetical protein
MEFQMVDRQSVGDLALAVLLALPLAAIAKSQPASPHQTASAGAVQIAAADRTPGGRMSLLG